jgi:hypothetical protein
MSGFRRVAAVVIVLAVLLPGVPGAQLSQAQADATYVKLMGIIDAGQSSRGSGRRTVLTESEMNAYLRFRAHTWLPNGLTDPRLDFVDVEKVATTVIADLDAVQRKSSGGWFDPTAYLRGRVPVHVIGRLATARGQGRFDLEQATVDGIPVPRMFIQELLSFYTRSPEYPDGVRIDQPFVLPSAIERIDVAANLATVVQ